MVYIITSKTRSKARRTHVPVKESRELTEAQRAKKSNKYDPQYAKDKRIMELHNRGYNEAAIAGMMDGEKNTTQSEAHVKKVIRKNKGNSGTVKTDGNL